MLLLDVSIPEKPKLRFVERAPLVPKVRREPKNLRDIRGPSTEATEFTEGNFAILVSSVSSGSRMGSGD